MKYTHKLPDATVNAPKKNILFEVLIFLTVLVFLGFAFYFFISKSLVYVVEKITPAQERKLASFMDFAPDMGEEKHNAYLQALTDKLALCADLPYAVETYLVETQERNAFALPSGKIYITRGMLQEIQNENELVGVIGHELGHFKHKDHLKGLGNTLVLTFLSLFLPDNYGEIIKGYLTLSQAKYSQRAEFDADIFGLSVMECGYGTVRGATTLFSRMNDGNRWGYFLESHPDFGSRVLKIKEKIKEKGYSLGGAITPLKERF